MNFNIILEAKRLDNQIKIILKFIKIKADNSIISNNKKKVFRNLFYSIFILLFSEKKIKWNKPDYNQINLNFLTNRI